MDGESQNEQDARVAKLWKSLNDGKAVTDLDLEGLRAGLRRLQHPLQNADSLLEAVLKQVDTNNDGRIHFSEFRVFVEHAERELWQMFQSIDRDHNGELDKKELHLAFEEAGLSISNDKLKDFFDHIDSNHDGKITFSEWRNFLLFLPSETPNLRAILSYYSSTVIANLEGDVLVSDETAQGLGYFVAGGIAGVISRTMTAPLDRLKTYLIAQTSTTKQTVDALNSGKAGQAVKHAARPLVDAMTALWKMGGVRSLFAGNGLNVVKVMPESAIKFGSYEGAKRLVAKFEGHSNPKSLSNVGQFFSAGMGGMIAQFAIYPLDTLKFRMQCETIEGGLRGNALIIDTAKKMYAHNGIRAYYRGLFMGLGGMFPFSAIDLTTYEYLKRLVIARNAKRLSLSEDSPGAAPSKATTGCIGALSSSFGATSVYPLNLLRTRLQSQGTAIHPPTYTGWKDCFSKTVKGEGVKGLYRGLTPNLLKVVPSMSISYMVYEYSKKAMGLK